MNNKFFELSIEKQLRIINAGFEVFSQNDYKRASTDLIAQKADISKGLLFYYFHNKKEFYLFLYDYAFKQIQAQVLTEHYDEIDDFFELCKYAGKRKYEILVKSPFLFDFVIRAFYSQKEDVSDELNQNVSEATSNLFANYFGNVDLSRFRDDIDPEEIYQMMLWMTDGYMHEQQRAKIPLNMDDVMTKYERWSTLLKRIAYKEDDVNEFSN